MNYAQIVETCCRDLRRYLEETLKSAKGGVVSVKIQKLLRVELPHSYRMLYAACLSRVLRPWRWNVGVYVVPRRDAETLLANFDELCTSAKRRRRPAETTRRIDTAHNIDATRRINTTSPATDGEMELISFHIPHALAQALDDYARLRNTTRSAIVRFAIAQLVERYRDVEVEIQPTAQVAPPTAALEDESILITFHETAYVVELLDMYATASQVSRSDVVRMAIQQMLDKMRATEEETEHLATIPTFRILAAPW